MKTLLQEMIISITNSVRNMVSEDLRNKSIVIRREQSCSEASKRMQNWLKENLQEVWDKDVWPPSSPDYSLSNYFVGAFLSYRSMLSLTTKFDPEYEGVDGLP
jgi:hypothetical protein